MNPWLIAAGIGAAYLLTRNRNSDTGNTPNEQQQPPATGAPPNTVSDPISQSGDTMQAPQMVNGPTQAALRTAIYGY